MDPIAEKIVDGWTWFEDYVILGSRDMALVCPTGRNCEVATGIATGGDVGPNRQEINPYCNFNIGPIGAVFVRAKDGKGPCKVKYFAGQINLANPPIIHF